MITWFKKSNFEFRNTNFEFSYTHVHVHAVYKLSENNTKAFKVVFFNFIALVSSRHVKTIYLHLWRNYVDVIYITEYKNPHKIELVHVILELIKKIVFQKTFPLFGRCGLLFWCYDVMIKWSLKEYVIRIDIKEKVKSLHFGNFTNVNRLFSRLIFFWMNERYQTSFVILQWISWNDPA